MLVKGIKRPIPHRARRGPEKIEGVRLAILEVFSQSEKYCERRKVTMDEEIMQMRIVRTWVVDETA